jgi:hypothetical protein
MNWATQQTASSSPERELSTPSAVLASATTGFAGTSTFTSALHRLR